MSKNQNYNAWFVEIREKTVALQQAITHPLMSKFARTYEKKDEELGVCKSCLDLSLSLRPKIFLLVKRIVEFAKSEALLFDGLSLKNQVVMQVIINFVDLKKSEIYLELVEEIENKGSSAIAPQDEEAVIKLAKVSRNALSTVLETQRYLIRRFNEKEEINENEFYAVVKQCRLQDHLLAATEIEYLARTTNYEFLVTKRLWQKSELECAVKELDATFTKNSRIHRVSDGQLNITTWPCRTRNLVSEPMLKSEDADLENYDDNDLLIDGDDLIIATDADADEEEPEELLSGPSASTLVTLMPEMFTSASEIATSSNTITETMTPEPIEGGVYKVSPQRLREALHRLISYKRKHDKWLSLAEQDTENLWKVRTKWKKDWYPLAFGELEQNPC